MRATHGCIAHFAANAVVCSLAVVDQLLGWFGIGINTLGGVLYSVAKYHERSAAKH